MKNLNLIEATRDISKAVIEYYGNAGDNGNGVFTMPSPVDGSILRIIASNGGGWDHVSVTRLDRCPTWEEMEHVKRMFFRDNETAMQLHVPLKNHINVHPYCLHLWRPQNKTIPLPPKGMVA